MARAAGIEYVNPLKPPMARNSYTVLVADDSYDDVALLKRAFKTSESAEFLEVLSNGDQVIDYFEGKGCYGNRQAHPIPDVLILDLRMPCKGGFEVLDHLRKRGLPFPQRVAILTGLARPADILRSYELGAHFIAHKDADFRSLVQRLDRAMSAGSTPPLNPDRFGRDSLRP